MLRVFEILNEPGADRREALRRVGVLASEANAEPQEVHVAAMERLVARTWPDARLLVTAVDVDRGEPVVWTRDSGVALHVAVASSSAAPGYVEPISVGERRYADGALGGGSNGHLAAGAGAVILIEPMPFPGAPVEADVRISPDEAAREAFGPDVGDRSRWADVFKAGLRQAAAVAEGVGPVLRREAAS